MSEITKAEEQPKSHKQSLGAQQEALGTKPLGKLLMEYALPSIIAMTATSLYNMADSIFIGQGDGRLGLTGLTVCFPLMNLSAAFGAMVGIGASSAIAVRLGQREVESAENAMGNVILLNVLIGTLFAVTSLLFLDPILTFFGASADSLPYARSYMEVLLYGNVLTHLYLGLNDCVRSSGYPRRAMAATLTAVVVNVLLDYVFIMQMGMGIRGAALATVLAQAVALCVVLSHLLGKESILHFHRRIFHWRWRTVRAIVSVGCAPFFVNLGACLVVLIINNSLAQHGGDSYIGAYGIVNRVAFIFIMVTQGINQGMQPIASFNYGAGAYGRSVRIYKVAAVVATIIMTFSFVVCEGVPNFIISWFNPDEEMKAIAVHAMRIMVAIFPLVGFQIITVGFLTALGQAHKAIVLSLSRQIICLVPLLLILPDHFGTDGVWYSMPISDAIAVFVAALLGISQVRILSKKQNSQSQKNVN